jgi:hypothetical protein
MRRCRFLASLICDIVDSSEMYANSPESGPSVNLAIRDAVNALAEALGKCASDDLKDYERSIARPAFEEAPPTAPF